MGMLFARRRKNKVEGITTTENLLVKEINKVENTQPTKVNSVPTNTQKKQEVVDKPTTQPKFKV